MNTGNKQLWGTVAVGGLLLGFAALASADLRAAHSQVSTASKEAARAAQSEDIETVHRHLQRLVNCLVGPKREAFDPDSGDPCGAQAGGAMRDLQSVIKVRMLVEQALSLAKVGLMIAAPGPARDVAQAAQQILVKAARQVAEERRKVSGGNR